jgi:hypothetical protein
VRGDKREGHHVGTGKTSENPGKMPVEMPLTSKEGEKRDKRESEDRGENHKAAVKDDSMSPRKSLTDRPQQPERKENREKESKREDHLTKDDDTVDQCRESYDVLKDAGVFPGRRPEDNDLIIPFAGEERRADVSTSPPPRGDHHTGTATPMVHPPGYPAPENAHRAEG